MSRVPWLSLGAFLVGIGSGLAYAWIAAPQHDSGTTPQTLRSDFKDQFRSSIAAAYSFTGDLGRARARLALLGDADGVQALSAQAQRALAEGQSFEDAQELARLASDLQAGLSSVRRVAGATVGPETASTASTTTSDFDLTFPATILTASPIAAAPSSSATVQLPTPTPSVTPISVPSAAFELTDKAQVCDPTLPSGLLQLTVSDDQGRPLPGIEITITWESGEERFFTGLQPEISNGYADYVMQAGTIYSVKVTRLGVPVSGLAAPVCTGAGGKSYIGGLKLIFKEP